MKAPENDVVVFTVGLKQRNVDKLVNTVWEVSDPKHEKYGQYWTRDQIIELVAPEEKVRLAVLDWISSAGPQNDDIVDIRDFGDAFRVVSNVKYVERLFQTRMHRFVHVSGTVRTRHMGTYSVPSHIRDLISIVTGIDEFPPIQAPKKLRASSPIAAAGGACNIPYTMKNLYNVSQSLTITNPGVKQAPYSLISSAKEGFGTKDLEDFDELNGIPAQTVECILGPAAGEFKNRSDDIEATLDIQMITSFGLGAKTCFWIETSWMYDFALDIINTENSPLVNSISYGWPEVASCSSVVESHCQDHDIPNAQAYVERSEAEFAKIALLGKTVVASSGDTGSPGPTNDDCTMTHHMLNPLYPTASAFITSVGATTLVPGKNSADDDASEPPICSGGQCQCSTDTKEIPCTLETAGFTTGGGFSDYVTGPSYQAKAVAAYVATGNSVVKPAQQYWNSSHRGFPDVAAIGNAVPIIVDGQMEPVGGTSASCPIVAGMISQLNNLRLNQGKPTLGLVNPLFYQIAAEVPNAFHDITAGGTACTESSCCKGYGFHATTGWDPVGGLGSLNFGVIYDYVKNMKN
jgi:tripeptidyl-peptidase-1